MFLIRFKVRSFPGSKLRRCQCVRSLLRRGAFISTAVHASTSLPPLFSSPSTSSAFQQVQTFTMHSTLSRLNAVSALSTTIVLVLIFIIDIFSFPSAPLTVTTMSSSLPQGLHWELVLESSDRSAKIGAQGPPPSGDFLRSLATQIGDASTHHRPLSCCSHAPQPGLQ